MRLARPLSGISCLRAAWPCVLVALALCGAGGCDTNGFVDPSELMRTRKDTLVLPILKQIDPGIEEADTQFANATEPLSEDHTYNATDYTISPNDLLAITLSDVAGPNTETVRQARVSESGFISLPLIGSIKAAGMTEIELEDEIVNQYRSKNLITNATVSVTVIEARGRAFSVLGAVNQPGEYAIVETDFRLLNALVLARNVASPFVDYIYIIRRPPPPHPASSRPAPRGTENPGGVIPPSTGPSTQELAPGASLDVPPAPIAKARSRDRVVHLTADQPQEVPANQPASTTPEQTKPEMLADETPAGGTSTATTTFSGFNNPDEGNGTRVIRVPYDALRSGDLNYNIPIRPHDLIYVPEPNVGVYYMAGHVSRPGVYTFNGQKVTLKQAIASAAMLDGIAIPQRTDIIRRVKPDHEVYVRVALDKIFAGEQPDIYLKPDDMVTVGTNMLAPFLAAVRGGFRITYGFGFLYDRNYAYSQNVAGGF